MQENNILLATISALLSSISTIIITKLNANSSSKNKELDTEPSRISAYDKGSENLFERYETRFDELTKEIIELKKENKKFRDDVVALTIENKELKEEVIKLTNENRKLTRLNQVLVDQVAELNVKLNNL